MAPPSRIVVAVQRLLLRLGQTPLRGLLTLLYRGIARAGAAYLTRGQREVGAFARGGLGTDDLVPGISDIDLAIVARDHRAADMARDRWQRLRRRLPAIDRVFEWPRVYDVAELRELGPASALTYGLVDAGAESDRAGYAGADPNLDRLRMLERPGLYGATADWRPLRGRDSPPTEAGRDRQASRIAAWLEILYLWRLALLGCADPKRAHVPLLCVKLIAEPARVWLWLAHGERTASRADTLWRALRRLPEQESSLRLGLELERALPDSPAPPLGEAMGALVRLSARIAELIEAEVAEHGTTEVRLAGGDAGASPLPLADWRALACPELHDESFAPGPGDPGDPAGVGALAASSTAGAYPALRRDSLIVLPASPLERTRLRAIKSRATDPAVLAVADCLPVAAFPNVRGWSAQDTARRATAEHRARLRAPAAADPDAELSALLAAARAALFLDSLRGDDPELCLTLAEAARRLGIEPGTTSVAAVRALVRGLPAYA